MRIFNSYLKLTYVIFMSSSKIVETSSPRRVDPFRIAFQCFKLPETNSQLIGFETDKIYTGRFYNGLYEISVDWGRSQPFVVERKQFYKYFQLIDHQGSLSAQIV